MIGLDDTCFMTCLQQCFLRWESIVRIIIHVTRTKRIEQGITYTGRNRQLFCKRTLIVNVCGKTVEEYVGVVERLSDTNADMLEINVSCPNVKEGAIAFGQDPVALAHITKEIKKKAKQPVIMKLSPNVTDIALMAKVCEDSGADAVSMINTITGMKIDVNRRTFVLANRTGGLSGPAIRPVAVRMVYQAASAVKIPVIGMGGITSAEDALEFIMAGAAAVAVGAANFTDPLATVRVIEGIEEYMRNSNTEDVKQLIGCVRDQA